MPQYQALKQITHDNMVIDPGTICPAVWVDEWTGYNAIGKMMRNGSIQMMPTEGLPEAIPRPKDIEQIVPTDLSIEDDAVIRGLLDKMPREDAIIWARSVGLIADPDLVPAPEEDSQLTEDSEPDTANGEPDGEQQGELFDPSDHNVQAVKDFVTEYPDTASDILDAEAAGKNRSGLLSWLEAFIESN